MFTSKELITDQCLKRKIDISWKYKPPETMKLFGSTKKLTHKTKNGEKL